MASSKNFAWKTPFLGPSFYRQSKKSLGSKSPKIGNGYRWKTPLRASGEEPESVLRFPLPGLWAVPVLSAAGKASAHV